MCPLADDYLGSIQIFRHLDLEAKLEAELIGRLMFWLFFLPAGRDIEQIKPGRGGRGAAKGGHKQDQETDEEFFHAQFLLIVRR
jgi:hypothetical protein